MLKSQEKKNNKVTVASPAFNAERTFKKIGAAEIIKKIAKSIIYSSGLIPNCDALREVWVRKKLARLHKGGSIIDVGAGEMIYKLSCQHLSYTSQDFGEFTGKNVKKGLPSEEFNARRVDIISDIIKIPAKSASFDYILCTEVFEHIPNPFAALKEISRIHRVGGTFILTAPHCSLTHFYPYYFYSGFSREFYKTVLPMFGYKIISLETNGNYFMWIAQELIRMPMILLSHSKIAFLFIIPLFLLTLPLLTGIRIVGILFPKSSDLLWWDTFVVAVKER